MKRIEIMVNQSIAEDLQENLRDAGLMEACTRWTPVYGTGHVGPREGSAVWPETNTVLLLFLPAEKIEILRFAVASLKGIYPDEGLKCFISEGPIEIL
jgi:nitrogen regulatory protein PII